MRFSHDWIQSIAAFIGSVAALVFLWLTFFDIKPTLKEIRLSNAISITHPADRAHVDLEEDVAGTSTLEGGYVRLIVTSPNGQEFLQNSITRPGKFGSWQLKAQFGEPDLGCDQPFLLRAVWSASKDLDVSKTGVSSDEIVVTRICS